MNDIRSIVTKSGMSDEPSYYSGGGPSTYYLGSEKLQKIAAGISESLTYDPVENKKALRAFVQMVIAQKDMSPTIFLQSLYNLERNKRNFDDTIFKHTNNNDIGDNLKTSGAVGFSLIAAALTGKSNKSTFVSDRISNEIKSAFLSEYCEVTPINDSTEAWLNDKTPGYIYTLKEELFEVLN